MAKQKIRANKLQTMDQFEKEFQDFNDAEKRVFFRKLGTVVLFHSSPRGRDVYPENAGPLGRAVPAMSRFASSFEQLYNRIARQDVDLGNPDLQKLVAHETYFRPEDENGKLVGEEPGIVETMIQTLYDTRNKLMQAMNDADTRKLRRRRGKPASPSKQESKSKPQKNAAESKKSETDTANS
jgi:hypothetical protein